MVKKAHKNKETASVVIRNSLESNFPFSSPDIIPWGTDFIDNPVPTLTDKEIWDKDIGKNIEQCKFNNIYLRAQNTSDGPVEGRFYLYYVHAELLMYPDEWKDNVLLTSSGKEFVSFTASEKNEIIATSEPFLFIPEMIVNGHYCLVGRIWTKEDPNPIPEDCDGVGKLLEYKEQHRNIAFRNLVNVSYETPSAQANFLYAQGVEKSEITFIYRWENLIPGKSVICLTSELKLPDKGSLCIPPTKVATKDGEMSVSASIPADWASNMTYFVDFHDEVPKHEYTVSVLATCYLDDTTADSIIGADTVRGVEPAVEACLNVKNVTWKKMVGEFPSPPGIEKTKLLVQREVTPKNYVLETVICELQNGSTTTPSAQFKVGYRQNNTAADLDFWIMCNNVPLGYSFALSSDSEDPKIDISKTEVTRKNMGLCAKVKDVPKGFSTTFTVSLWQNETPADLDAMLTFLISEPIATDDPTAEFADWEDSSEPIPTRKLCKTGLNLA